MRRCAAVGLIALLLNLPVAVSAAVHEARIPLHDHKLKTSDVSAALLETLHLPGVGVSVGGVESIDLSGLRGSRFVAAWNKALGEGCNVELQKDVLVLRMDPKKLPRNFDSIRAAARVFTAVAAPTATANQRRLYGLFLPERVDSKPMVVLVHGLDCNRANWFPMADLLIGEGFQVAYFAYPSDQPLEDSAQLFAQHMTALRESFQSTHVDIVAHSMGGLVARRYVEGAEYAGGIDHLILLGTPNLGTRWAAYRVALEIEEHYGLWRREPGWSPTWMITDGLGEAGRDLKPTSTFLKDLNARPRRAEVKYTIVAGAQHPIYPIASDALTATAGIIPERAAGWWGFRQTDHGLRRAADKLRERTGKSDGPVSVGRTHLEGVDDHVTLPCDHASLYYPVEGGAPAAWDVIRERLTR